MATLTIKIDSEELAREVLAHLGYLPEDDPEMPDLVTDVDEEPKEDEDKTWTQTNEAIKNEMNIIRKELENITTEKERKEYFDSLAKHDNLVVREAARLVKIDTDLEHKKTVREFLDKVLLPNKIESVKDLTPKSTRGVWGLCIPDGKFCTTEEPKEGVEPAENEMGASLEVFSDETDKEREEIRQQCLEVKKSLPGAKDRLAAQIDELVGGDRLDYLDTIANSDDKEMREAVKAYVIKEYTGHDLHLWPALHKILEC
jgi:hypothetical protein